MHRLLVAALITSLIACGSDDDSGPDSSLTEPGSSIDCETSTAPVDFTGTYSLEWGCGGEWTGAQQPTELEACDPANNPLLGEESATVSVEFQGERTVTLGAWSVDGEAIAPGFVLIGDGTDNGQMRMGGGITGCSDGRFAFTMTWKTLDGERSTYWGAEMRR